MSTLEPGTEPRHPVPDERPPVPFTIFDGLGLVVWTIVAQVLVAGGAAGAGVDLAAGGPSTLLVLFLAQVFSLAGALAWLSSRGRLDGRLLGWRPPAWADVPVGVVVGVIGFVLLLTVLTVANGLLGPFEAPEQTVMEESLRGGVRAVLGGLVAVVGAPVLEEVVFRGVLMQALREKLGLWPALVGSSALWALVHFEVTVPVYSGALLLLGVWLGWVFHRRGGLVVAIVGHAVFNGIQLTWALLVSQWLPGS